MVAPLLPGRCHCLNMGAFESVARGTLTLTPACGRTLGGFDKVHQHQQQEWMRMAHTRPKGKKHPPLCGAVTGGAGGGVPDRGDRDGGPGDHPGPGPLGNRGVVCGCWGGGVWNPPIPITHDRRSGESCRHGGFLRGSLCGSGAPVAPATWRPSHSPPTSALPPSASRHWCPVPFRILSGGGRWCPSRLGAGGNTETGPVRGPRLSKGDRPAPAGHPVVRNRHPRSLWLNRSTVRPMEADFPKTIIPEAHHGVQAV